MTKTLNDAKMNPVKTNTPWAIKRSQLIFVCNLIKNQLIFMQFPLIDLKMNHTCDSINDNHPA